MNFKAGDITIDTRDGDRYRILTLQESFFEGHLRVKVISSEKNPAYIGLSMFVPTNQMRLEKSRDKSHPLTNIFK